MCGLSTNMETLIVARFVCFTFYLADVNALSSFSFLVLVVVVCQLLHRKLPFLLITTKINDSSLSIIVSDMYSLRVSADNALRVCCQDSSFFLF